MKNTLTIKTAFGIVIASLFSAFFAGALVLGIGLSNPEEPQKTYTFISFIIGQGFMLVPLFGFLDRAKSLLLKGLGLDSLVQMLLFLLYTYLLE